MTNPSKHRALGHPPQRFLGKFRGVVANNLDPLNQARLQAKVPEVLGNAVSNWAVPCAPYAGPQAGFFAVPPVGAGVWIEFEAGDPSRPIWVGGWWGTGEVPVSSTGTAVTPSVKILRTDGGLILSFDDAAQTITVSDAGSQNQLFVDVRKGVIKLQGATQAVLESSMIHAGSESAAHPAVLGDQLVSYLVELVTAYNTHVHPIGPAPAVSGPPLSPLRPPPSAVVSLKVMLE
jgi:hypothetical protein